MSAPASCRWANQLCEQPNHHGCDTRCPLVPRTPAVIYAELAATHDAPTRDQLLDELLTHREDTATP